MDNLILRSRAYGPELKEAAEALEAAVWHRLGFLSRTRAHCRYYDRLLEKFADYQLCLVDPATDLPLAVSSCVPFTCRDPDELPAEGWDWLVEAAALREGPANLLGALAVSVSVEHRNKGYARRMIRAMRELADRKGLDGVVVPVRPSAKAKHPHVPIKDYIEWKDGEGRLYDPWLRSHVLSGGRILRPCERSMVVEEPIAFWENWSGQPLDRSGDYAIEGGLVPLSVNLDKHVGRYVEPNVWVAYLN